jgi:hypothetical protein
MRLRHTPSTRMVQRRADPSNHVRDTCGRQPDHLEEARLAFAGLVPVQIVTSGELLGGFVGDDASTQAFLDERVQSVIRTVNGLTELAKEDPQNAPAPDGHTCSKYCPILKPQWPTWITSSTRSSSLPAIFGFHFCTAEERRMISLPPKEGGLHIPIFAEIGGCRPVQLCLHRR